ncbi:MAG: DNA adenine methylase [Firmicutes bacterium]|nr:DNA adenine methylase [Bacillota bacterium]
MSRGFSAKPFLKWAGGKTQLLAELSRRLPAQIKESKTISTYVEPFLGGGAFFFYLQEMFALENVYLMDINKELMLAYKVVQREPEALISHLDRLEEEYLCLDTSGRRELYYQIRQQYNRQRLTFDYGSYGKDWSRRASQLIFLNKTCFNGLFRQNKRGEFNVPHGRYKKPAICAAANIREVSKALAGVNLLCADFLSSEAYVQAGSLVYFDPPYRPLTRTARFTSYTGGDFTDEDQIRLAKYFRKLDQRNAFLLLSNSDPVARDPRDDFFDHLYRGFRMERVFAKRNINCHGKKRGEITELIIRNY